VEHAQNGCGRNVVGNDARHGLFPNHRKVQPLSPLLRRLSLGHPGDDEIQRRDVCALLKFVYTRLNIPHNTKNSMRGIPLVVF
jgi:hypothetical protein